MPIIQNFAMLFVRSKGRLTNCIAAMLFFILIAITGFQHLSDNRAETSTSRDRAEQHPQKALVMEPNYTSLTAINWEDCHIKNSAIPNRSNPINRKVITSHDQHDKKISSARKLLRKEKAYFIETSGKLSLSWRQACALESFARHNSHVGIELLLIDPDGDGRAAGNAKAEKSFLVQLLACHYGNINVKYQPAKELVKNTILEKWYSSSGWRDSPYKTAHLSDGIRLLTLCNLGGFYFDLDIIHIRSIDNIRNFFTLQDSYQVCNAAVHSRKGHPIMKESLQDFVQNYKSDVWDHNGPVLLTSVLKRWCKNSTKETEHHIECRGFRAYAPPLFYPIDFEELDVLFSDVPGAGNYSFAQEVIGVHTWNKLSHTRPVYKHSKQLYNLLASDNCPVIFDRSPALF